jgi:peptidoglycan/xylan/chitin deacetylase (PgdA/CDA1 family)
MEKGEQIYKLPEGWIETRIDVLAVVLTCFTPRCRVYAIRAPSAGSRGTSGTTKKLSNMRVSIFLVLIFSTLLSFGQKKQVCFSFDDLPVVNYAIADSNFQKDLFNKLLLSLNTYKIPAIGFVNEGKLYENGHIKQYQVELLKSWINDGLDLGNHTYSHKDYNSVSLADYSKDILKGETITRQILDEKGKSIQYFRYPFLHAGNTKAKADSLSDFLKNRGYKIGAVTIDNEDYLFAFAYKRTKEKKDSSLMKQIGHEYIVYMEKKMKYYEMQAIKLFGRDISQILLVHASSLNSDYIDSLANMFQRNNYIFVNMDKALEDEVYKTDITVYGNWGISWIDKWALSQGKKGDFFKDEPVTPDYIKRLSE